VSCGFLPLLLLFLGSPLHLYRKKLSSCSDSIFSPALAARLAVADGLSLERRRATIEHKDGLDADEEELADSAKEAHNVAVAQGIALFITHSFKELVNPDGGIDSEALLVQRFDLDGTRAWLQDGPEASDTHGRVLETQSIGLRQVAAVSEMLM
jgi:hypothetical protein